MTPEDLKELLRALQNHGVKYLIVGGYAFGVHAEPRATKDLYIFIRSDEQNSKALFQALAQYGAPVRDVPAGGRLVEDYEAARLISPIEPG